MRRFYLWDKQNDTSLTLEWAKGDHAMELFLKGPKGSLYDLMRDRNSYGVADNELIYKWCKEIIYHLDKVKGFSE